MTDSDDEEYAFYGTPLQPIEEGEVPRKKPLSLEEQEVTDKHGRRRFHGAFTGGFSAGFFNSVGSLEGWKPSTFKSSRSERSQVKTQQPIDFMDDEDTEEFGIGQQVLKAKPDYEKKERKRKGGFNLNDGPIPGEPVLQSILRPAKETIGVLLLMKMGWKPGQGIGPKLTKLEKKMSKKKVKVYGCRLPSKRESQSDSDGSSDDDHHLWDPKVLFAPIDIEPFCCLQPKGDSAGLGYKGLDRGSVLGPRPTVKNPFTLTDQHKKKISIMGQAFGVGAFEEEDEDIYSVEDMSNYDFSLGKKEDKMKLSQKQLAITDGGNYFLGYVGGKLMVKKNYFVPPDIPAGFTPFHASKKSRFDEVTSVGQEKSFKSFPTKRLDSVSRGAILGETSTTTNLKQESDNETNEETPPGWQPFSCDPAKQERYNKFLHMVKIGAKDALKNIQPFTMTHWERERELKEFEEVASRLNTSLSGFLGERFTHGGEGVKAESSTAIQAAANKMFGQLTRTTETWTPHSVVCKRFNIKPPNSSGELEEVGKKTRPKFSVFDFLEASKSNQLSSLVEDGITAVKEEPDDEEQGDSQTPPVTQPTRVNSPPTQPQGGNEFEDPPDKMDLFKAIFESSGESEEEAEVPLRVAPAEPEAVLENTLRNTSPPRGIFANIEQVIKTQVKQPSVDVETSPPNGHSRCGTPPVLDDAYGPRLPSTPAFTAPPKTVPNLDLDVDDGLWVEKAAKSSFHLSKSHKKHKKEKKKKHKKKKKKSRHSDSD